MSMEDSLGSVTPLIRRLGGDDPEAAAKLWKRFEPLLLKHIFRVIRRGPKLGVGEDAIANVVFQNLLTLARQGRFSGSRRGGFIRVMKMIAKRRVVDQRRRESRKKRGGRNIITESVVRNPSDPPHRFLDGFPGKTPSPEFSAMSVDFYLRISSLLDEELRLILDLRLDGHTLPEIAKTVQRSVPTIERKLRLIRKTLEIAFEVRDDSR